MQKDRHTVTNTIKRYRSFRYWLVVEAVVVGVAAGVVIVAFRLLLEKAAAILGMALNYGKMNPWFIPVWFLILAAAATAVTALLKWEPYISGSGIPQIEGEILSEIDQKWWRVLLAKCAGGLLSLGGGLSLGREGPSIQLGAMVAKGFSRITKRVKTEEKLLMTCGASAGLAAAFNAPIAGVLFSLEEIHKHFSPEILLSSMASSITADFVSRNVFGLKPIFTFDIPNMMPLQLYGHVLILGLFLGVLGIAYNLSISKSQDLYQKITFPYLRVLLPFLAAGVLGFVYPVVTGGGHSLVESLSAGEMAFGALFFLFAVKFCFSMVSFGSGAPGGIFLPLLVLGAVAGGMYHTVLRSVFPSIAEYLPNFLILGMAGYFTAIVRAPITGIILISEMTGTFSHLLTLCMVTLMAYLVPDVLKVAPVYDQLLTRILKNRKQGADLELSGDKVLVEGLIYHGCAAEGLKISEIAWPKTSLVVSLQRGEAEFVPRGDTKVLAGDKVVVLCDEAAAGLVHRTLEEVCKTVSMR